MRNYTPLGETNSRVNRNHSWYGLSQWEMTLRSNIVSHWLSPYPEWSLVKNDKKKKKKTARIAKFGCVILEFSNLSCLCVILEFSKLNCLQTEPWLILPQQQPLPLHLALKGRQPWDHSCITNEHMLVGPCNHNSPSQQNCVYSMEESIRVSWGWKVGAKRTGESRMGDNMAMQKDGTAP